MTATEKPQALSYQEWQRELLALVTSDPVTFGAAPFRLEARRLALEQCANWTGDDQPLGESYRLLNFFDLENAWIGDMQDQARGRYVFPIKADTGQYPFRDFRGLVPRLLSRVVERLKVGDLIAYGVEPGRELRGKRTVIPATAWDSLRPDFERSTVRDMDGHVVASDVIVSLACAATIRSRSLRPVPTGELDRWMTDNHLKYENRELLHEAAVADLPQWKVTVQKVRKSYRRIAGSSARTYGRPEKRTKKTDGK